MHRNPNSFTMNKINELSSKLVKLQSGNKEREMELETAIHRLELRHQVYSNIWFKSELSRKEIYYEGIIQKKNIELEKIKIEMMNILQTLQIMKEQNQ